MKKIVLIPLLIATLGYFGFSFAGEINPKKNLHEIYIETQASSKCFNAPFYVGKEMLDILDLKVNIHCNSCYSGVLSTQIDGSQKCSACNLSFFLK